jgi:hypothetical protein
MASGLQVVCMKVDWCVAVDLRNSELAWPDKYLDRRFDVPGHDVDS